MVFILLSLIGGLVFLSLGANGLIKGAVTLSRNIGVSQLVVGLTIVAFGTSMPEFVTAMQAVRVGATDLVLGNVVGSNILNILLILGLAALFKPFRIQRRSLRRDALMVLVLSAGATWAITQLPVLPRWLGLAAMAAFGFYLANVYRHERRRAYALPEQVKLPGFLNQTWVALGLVVAGLLALTLGSSLLVEGAIQLAERLGAPQSIIGLTVLALGTTLPEMATTITAVHRKNPELAVGNILGSNIFNMLGILGTSAALHPIVIPATITHAPVWTMLAAAIALPLYARAGGYKLGRAEGALFLAGLGTYLAILF